MKTDNELIADFMGLKLCDCGMGHPHYKTGELNWQTVEVSQLKYHTSWDELKPVIDKISNHHSPELIMPEDLGSVEAEKYFAAVALPVSSPIEEVYKEVVEFIKWYNDNGKVI